MRRNWQYLCHFPNWGVKKDEKDRKKIKIVAVNNISQAIVFRHTCGNETSRLINLLHRVHNRLNHLTSAFAILETLLR